MYVGLSTTVQQVKGRVNTLKKNVETYIASLTKPQQLSVTNLHKVWNPHYRHWKYELLRTSDIIFKILVHLWGVFISFIFREI